jgi:chromosome segregation ATPase
MEEYGELGQAGDWEQQIKALPKELSYYTHETEDIKDQKQVIKNKVEDLQAKLKKFKHSIKQTPDATALLTGEKAGLLEYAEEQQKNLEKQLQDLKELEEKLNHLLKQAQEKSKKETEEEGWFFID